MLWGRDVVLDRSHKGKNLMTYNLQKEEGYRLCVTEQDQKVGFTSVLNGWRCVVFTPTLVFLCVTNSKNAVSTPRGNVDLMALTLDTIYKAISGIEHDKHLR